MEKINNFIMEQYGLNVTSIDEIMNGVGGDTYLVTTTQGKFILKYRIRIA